MFSSIDVVAQKEIVALRWKTTHFKETDEVTVLSVDITNDLDRRTELNEGGLAEEDFARSKT